MKQIDALETVLHLKFNVRLSKLWKSEGCRTDTEKLLTNEFLNSGKHSHYSKTLKCYEQVYRTKAASKKQISFDQHVSVIDPGIPLSTQFISYLDAMRSDSKIHHSGTKSATYVMLNTHEGKPKLLSKRKATLAGLKDNNFGDKEDFDNWKKHSIGTPKHLGVPDPNWRQQPNSNHLKTPSKVTSNVSDESDPEEEAAGKSAKLPKWLIDATDLKIPEATTTPRPIKKPKVTSTDSSRVETQNASRQKHFRVLSNFCTPESSSRKMPSSLLTSQVSQTSLNEPRRDKFSTIASGGNRQWICFDKPKTNLFTRNVIKVKKNMDEGSDRAKLTADMVGRRKYQIVSKSQTNSQTRLVASSRDQTFLISPAQTGKADVSALGSGLAKPQTVKTSRDSKQRSYCMELPIEDTIKRPNASLFKPAVASGGQRGATISKNVISQLISKIKSIEGSPVLKIKDGRRGSGSKLYGIRPSRLQQA